MTREQKGRYLPPKDEIGPYFPGEGDFRLLFLNTNPYNMGIANLGWQAVVEYILAACPFVSIQVEYADTIESANLNPLDFDLIAMHIPFEINYAVAIKMLNQIGLPLMSGERDDSLPMIIAGGVYNPLPLADFIDVFVLGDGRLPMVKLINLCFSEQGNKRKIIGAALGSKLKGEFIPDFNNIQKYIFASPELPLNEFPIHTIWSSRDNVYGLSADYLSIMVALGCKHKCPFCIVSHCQGVSYDKETEISANQVLEILNWRRQFTPVKTVKLFFASSVDRVKLKRIIGELIKEKVEVLVGSLNCQQIDEEFAALLKSGGQNNIIVAPETNQGQRWKISKGYITDERIYEIVKLANKYAMPISLYLMYGLPGETNKDILEMGSLVKGVRLALDSKLEMQIHCNQVFLKPHTPWQYAKQISPEESVRRFNLFLGRFFDIPGIEVKTMDICSSVLQSLLARGNREMGRLLLNLVSAPPLNLKEMIKRLDELMPDWRRYFAEREFSEAPWSQIIFQDHGVLWQRWLNFKKRLK